MLRDKIAKRAYTKISPFKNILSYIHTLCVLAGIMKKPDYFIPDKGMSQEYQKLKAFNLPIDDERFIIAKILSQQQKQQMANLGKRASNGKMEDLRLDFLVNTPTYKNRLLSEVSRILGREAVSVRKLGGRGRADFIFTLEDGQEVGMEVKGFTGKPKIDITRPWHNTTPQTANINKKYKVDITFADDWYDNVLPMFKNEFSMEQPIPKKSDWMKEDMFHMGSCKTEFSKELRHLCNTKPDVKARISEMVNDNIKTALENMTDQEKIRFGDITKNKLNTKLSEKPLWLNISYEKPSSVIPSEQIFSIFETPLIGELVIVGPTKLKKSHVIKFKYTTTASNGMFYEGEARPRFRNGTGIANFGWNIKPY
jgi:hypothetical protein